MKTILPWMAGGILLAAAVPCDGGAVTWRSVGPGGGSFLMACAIQPDDPNVIYVGGDIEGAFKTSDGGQTWKMANNGLGGGDRPAATYGVQELVIDPTNYQTVYACTWTGLFRSTDGAESWSLLYPEAFVEEEMPGVSYLAVDPNDGQRLYAGFGDADKNVDGLGLVIRSTDGGATWQPLALGAASDAVIHGIVIDPTSPQGNRRVFVSTDKGVFRSTDGGTTWSPVNTGLPHTNARRLVASTAGGSLTLFLGLNSGESSTFNGGIYRSTDGGDSWTSITGDLPHLPYEGARDEGAPFYDYWKFDVHPSNTNILLAATNLRGWGDLWGLYKTSDGGQTWVKANPPENTTYGWLDNQWWNDENISILKFAPSNPDVIITGSEFVEKSTDGGATWLHSYSTKVGDAWEGNGLELMEVYDFGFDPTDPNVIYLATDDMGMWRSDDGGESYVRLDNPQNPEDVDCARSLVVDPENGNLYLGRTGGDDIDWGEGFVRGRFATSTNRGDTWTFSDPSSVGLPEGKLALVMDRTSPASARVLYCAVFGYGVYKTSDGGLHWAAVNTGLGSDAGYAWDVAIAPSNPQTLYLALNSLAGMGDGGLYKTTNGGQNWLKLANLPGGDVLSLAVDPTNAAALYVGLTDSYEYSTTGGVYRSLDGGANWTKVLDQPRVGLVLVHPTEPGVVFAASQPWWNYAPTTNSGVHRSMDGGATWEDITGNLGHTWVIGARINPHKPGQLWVGTHGGGTWVADDVRSPTGVEHSATRTPSGFILEQNAPNPFNPATTIRYYMPRDGHVKIEMYSLTGQRIQTLVDGPVAEGVHAVTWDASDVASGVYLYRAIEGDRVHVRRCVVLK